MSQIRNRWWEADRDEIYWLESTDREDLGANLHAPQKDDSGQENWRYSLICEARPGDVVFHYHKTEQGIIATSVVAEAAVQADIVWGARGTHARKKGTLPRRRSGWRVALKDFQLLARPLTLDRMRDTKTKNDIRELRDRLVERHRKPLYFPIELSEKRPPRMLQGYAFKLPRDFVKHFSELHPFLCRASKKTVPQSSNEARNEVGTVYRVADEAIRTQNRRVYHVDPDAVDRSLRGHRATQNALSNFLVSRNHEPLSPTRGSPQYDIAWQKGEMMWVAEVKSLTDSNEETQLRLGLGQVLRYRHQLESSGRPVVAVLAVERQPSDGSWVELCAAYGVRLVWPETFATLG